MLSTKFLSMRKEEAENGFTLIELMIVVVIIGILAAVAIPIFANQQKTAIDAATLSDLKSANVAIVTWKTKNPQQTSFPSNGVGIKELTNFSDGTNVSVFGKPNNYCLKAFNVNGGQYTSNGSPYAIFISETGKTGPSLVLGSGSQLSCGTQTNNEGFLFS